MAVERALDGMVVLELGGREGAAICGSLLSQLGATVIVVESPEQQASLSPRDAHRAQFVAGKLSFAPRQGDEADAALLRRLAERSDVVLTSSDLDTEPLGLTFAADGNVVADITAFGNNGPLAGQPYTEAQIQALSGIADTTGDADGPPVSIGVPIVGYLAGTYAASAVLAALRVKRQQGRGQKLHVAMFDSAFVTLNAFLSSVLTNPSANKTRIGNRHPTVAPWNVYESKDGLVLICAGNQGQWERLCALMERPDIAETYKTQESRLLNIQDVDAAIEAWTRTVTTEDCVEALASIAVAAGPIAPVNQYPRESNLQYRGMIRELFDPLAQRTIAVPASPLRMQVSPGRAPAHIPAPGADRAEVERIADRPAAPAAPVGTGPLKRPLEGLRVVEIGQYTTAPLCARHLAHLGADIVKIEQPGGDESRTWMPNLGGRSVSFRLNNADKRSLILNLRTEKDVDILKALLRTADVLVENSKPGTLTKFGLSPEQIKEINPRLVYCAISGFGADSLYPKRPAFDMVIQAMSGFMASLRSGEAPLKSGISTADTMGAEMAMVAILGALEFRDRGGSGQYIDLSMQDISCWLTQTAWNKDLATTPRPTMVPCSDGYVLVEAEEALVRQRIGEARTDETREALVSRCQAAGLLAAPVNSVREASTLPQTLGRRLWYTMVEDGLEWPMLASPLRLDLTPPKVTHLAPAANQHSNEILSELGLAAQ